MYLGLIGHNPWHEIITGGCVNFVSTQPEYPTEPELIYKTPWICAHCGIENPPEAQFCGQTILFAGCGAPKDRSIVRLDKDKVDAIAMAFANWNSVMVPYPTPVKYIK